MYRIAGCLGGCGTEKVDNMLKGMLKEGSNQKRLYTSNNATLGCNKSTMKDSSGDIQPLFNEDNTIALVFDGEIYNYDELKAWLLSRGHEFKTDHDGEVLIHLYEELGSDMVSKLDGVFAFAISGPKGFFAARDVLGARPLYYCEDKSGKMYFASEIKALLNIADNIKEFPNGYYYTDKDGFFQYDRICAAEVTESNLEELVDDLDRRLNEAVKKRLMSDKPVGVFLSGGLDSSLIAAITRQYVKGELYSFAVGVKGSDDLYYSQMVSDFLGTTHHVEEYNKEDVIEILPDVIYHLESFDPALVRGSVATYFAARLASRYVKVVLIGEGADELFGGYEYLKAPSVTNLTEELLTLINSLHNTGFQRIDRITAAHSITARAPFLDREVINYAFSLDEKYKIYGEEKIEKWIVRKVAERYLPKEIAWRKKAKFAHGTGTSGILSEWVKNDDVVKEAIDSDLTKIPSREEMVYLSIFNKHFTNLKNLELIGRTRSIVPKEIV